MCKQGLIVLVLAFGLGACGGSPSDDESKAQDAPDKPATATSLRDAAQGPLDRANAVQQTMDAHGAQVEAQTEDAYGVGAAQDEETEPNPDDEDEGYDGQMPDEGDELPMPDDGDEGDDQDPDEGDE
jgi:hypothetical protein